MAKSSGLGDNFYVAGYDVSGDIQSLSKVGGGPAVIDLTDITESAFDRVGGLLSGEMSFSSFFNVAANRSHARFSTLPTTDVIVSYLRGTALGDPVANIKAKQINYDGTRDNAGNFTFALQDLSNLYPLEWGVSGTAGKRTDGSGTNGTSVDLGSASPGAYGLSAYLHVFAFTGTSVTVKLQESSDNGGGDAFADIVGGGFTAASGITSQRIQTGLINVERYVRVVTTGTFSNAVFAVGFTRYDTTPGYS